MDISCSYYKPKNRGNYPHGKGYCYVIANFCGYVANDPVQIYNFPDVAKIQNFFQKNLGYEYDKSENLTKKCFFETLHKIKSFLNNERNNCIDRFFLFILSHGSEEGIYMCNDSEGRMFEKDGDGKKLFVTMDEISSHFDHSSIPSLKGHPKCIFIHACRGCDITRAACISDKNKSLPNTRITSDPPENLNNENPTIDDSDHHDVEDDVINVENGTSLLHVKRPSSENMLVAFSCMKETKTLLDNKATYIDVVISTLDDHHKKEHLLDMIVDITRKIGAIKFEYHVPIIYKMDSTRELVLVGEGESENDCCVVASGGYRVYQFEGHKGMVEEKELKVEEKHDIQCLLKFTENANESTARFQNVKFPVAAVNTILSNENVSIPDSADCLLFSDGETIGVGKLKIINGKIATIEKRVLKCNGDVVYEGKLKCESGYGNGTVDLIGTKCKIMESSFNCNDKKLIAEGTIHLKHGVPVLGTEVYQLPIFETTFTKKFYLWKDEPDSDSRVTSTTSSGKLITCPREAGGEDNVPLSKITKQLERIKRNMKTVSEDYEDFLDIVQDLHI